MVECWHRKRPEFCILCNDEIVDVSSPHEAAIWRHIDVDPYGDKEYDHRPVPDQFVPDYDADDYELERDCQ